jgi:hypothetical protein
MKNDMLTYRRSDKLEVIGYTDFDFMSCVDSLKSTSGYIFMLVGGAISWRSAKQSMIASSTMTAEFIAIKLSLKLYCDNSLTVLYSNDNRSSSKFKYIDIKFLAVKEKVQSGFISIEHIGTSSMLADPLTKGLIPKQFHEHVAHMGIYVTEDY